MKGQTIRLILVLMVLGMASADYLFQCPQLSTVNAYHRNHLYQPRSIQIASQPLSINLFRNSQGQGQINLSYQGSQAQRQVNGGSSNMYYSSTGSQYPSSVASTGVSQSGQQAIRAGQRNRWSDKEEITRMEGLYSLGRNHNHIIGTLNRVQGGSMGTRSISQVNVNANVNVNTNNGQSQTVYGSAVENPVQQVSQVQEVQNTEPVVSAAAESQWQRIQQRIADQHRQRVLSTIQAENLSKSAGSQNQGTTSSATPITPTTTSTTYPTTTTVYPTPTSPSTSCHQFQPVQGQNYILKEEISPRRMSNLKAQVSAFQKMEYYKRLNDQRTRQTLTPSWNPSSQTPTPVSTPSRLSYTPSTQTYTPSRQTYTPNTQTYTPVNTLNRQSYTPVSPSRQTYTPVQPATTTTSSSSNPAYPSYPKATSYPSTPSYPSYPKTTSYPSSSTSSSSSSSFTPSNSFLHQHLRSQIYSPSSCL